MPSRVGGGQTSRGVSVYYRPSRCVSHRCDRRPHSTASTLTARPHRASRESCQRQSKWRQSGGGQGERTPGARSGAVGACRSGVVRVCRVGEEVVRPRAAARRDGTRRDSGEEQNECECDAALFNPNKRWAVGVAGAGDDDAVGQVEAIQVRVGGGGRETKWEPGW